MAAQKIIILHASVAASTAVMEDAHKHMEEEYYRLSRAINKGIDELGSKYSSVTCSPTPAMAPSTLSRILAEMDMDLAEAEGQVSFLIEIMGSKSYHIRSCSATKKREVALMAGKAIFIKHRRCILEERDEEGAAGNPLRHAPSTTMSHDRSKPWRSSSGA